jgi:hypothetical protein
VRSVLVRPGRELLQGRVEVDETYIGGIAPGLSGGRAKGKKALVAIAVERVEPRGFGRFRMAWLLLVLSPLTPSGGVGDLGTPRRRPGVAVVGARLAGAWR